VNRPHVTTLATTGAVAESAANTETVAATLGPIITELPNQTIAFSGNAQYTPPAAITSLTIRVRRDSLTGTIVGVAVVDAADPVATKLGVIAFDFVDQPAGMIFGNYVLTFQGTGEGAAGSMTGSVITAIVG
jgi:hypothetical protein